MDINRKTASSVLWCEAAGFILLTILPWMDSYHTSWHESALESGSVLAVGIAVFFFTSRLIYRLYYLEGFLRVCSWCRKINRDEQWVPLEQYFSDRFDTKTSHGMCPECAVRFRAEMDRARSAQKP
jgi:hypothetical protein